MARLNAYVHADHQGAIWQFTPHGWKRLMQAIASGKRVFHLNLGDYGSVVAPLYVELDMIDGADASAILLNLEHNQQPDQG